VAFVIYDGLGALLWAGAAVAVGRAFHRAIDRVLLALENLGWWAMVVIGALLTVVVILKWMQRIEFLKKLRLARIQPEELKDLIDRGASPVVLDVRTHNARKRDARRIPTALLAQLDRLEEQLANLPPGTEIVLYCT